jgi:pyruvate/2-oxoglutarate dehydrogenase complex dihydrolipoamide acyltransferase (E2) component
MGDILAEVERDKGMMEMEAFDDGVLKEIYVADGGVAEVGEKIGLILAEGESAPSLAPQRRMRGQIFISYRREDSMASAGRLYDYLSTHFALDKIFMDVDSLELGVDFVEAIDESVSSCEVLSAVIGKHWLTSSGLLSNAASRAISASNRKRAGCLLVTYEVTVIANSSASRRV